MKTLTALTILSVLLLYVWERVDVVQDRRLPQHDLAADEGRRLTPPALPASRR